MAETTRPERCNSSNNSKMILNLIKNFENKRVLVIGDSILDDYVYAKSAGLSLETPTLLAEQEKEEFLWGGASNVVKNILELGANVGFITLLGEDKDSEHYLNFKHENFKLFPVIERGRKTTVKKRFFIEKSGVLYKYLEIHNLNNKQLNSDSEKKVLEYLKENLKLYDILLIIDQAEFNYGIMSDFLINEIKKIAKQNNKPLIINSQIFRREPNHKKYSGADIISMNLKEAKTIYPEFTLEKLPELYNMLGSNVCMTLGEKGSLLFLNNKKYESESIKVKEIDSCGAGDSFISAFLLSDPLENPEQALLIGNIWAGLSVTKLGTEVPKKQELIDYINP